MFFSIRLSYAKCMWPFAKRWLEQVAWFYPAVFLAVSAAFGLPQFLISLLPGMELTRSEISRFGWMTGSMAANVIAPADAPLFGIVVLAAIVVMLITFFLRRFNPAMAGMAAAFYGFALSQSFIVNTLLMNRKTTFDQAAGALLGFGCLTFGLIWLLDGFPLNKLGRFGWLAVGLLLPAALVASQFARGPRRTTWRYFAMELALPLFAAILASLVQHAARPHPGFERILFGLGMSALLWGGADYVGKLQASSKEPNRESQLAALPAPKSGAPYETAFFQKGVSFTAEFPVPYGEPTSRRMLEALPQFGINAIALIPYGRLRRDRSLESDIGLEILIRQAHQQGMRVLLKPHSRKPSEQDLPKPEDVAAWFRNHLAFILEYAKFAERTHADLFCVGTEFGWLSRYESEWRALIGEVRKVYRGPLVYAPNHGPEFENVQFWDALDYIGIDNYYPLGDDYSTAKVLESVEKVQSRFQKPVVFTEAGFSAAVGAHKEPWADETNYPLSLEVQERCYEALLQTFYAKPWFHGFYWWKVGTNGYGGPQNNSMTPWRKPAMEILKRYYVSPTR